MVALEQIPKKLLCWFNLEQIPKKRVAVARDVGRMGNHWQLRPDLLDLTYTSTAPTFWKKYKISVENKNMGGCQISRGGSFLFKGVKEITTFLQILLQGGRNVDTLANMVCGHLCKKKTRQTKKVHQSAPLGWWRYRWGRSQDIWSMPKWTGHFWIVFYFKLAHWLGIKDEKKII